jgi:hypothetical protein
MDLSAWSLNGSAVYSGTTTIQLTDTLAQAGSAWAPCPVDLLHDFDLQFMVYLGDGVTVADGIAFVLQNATTWTTALGAAGGGLGYGDLTASLGYDPTTGIHPSLDAEIDDNFNDEMTFLGEASCDHLAMLKDGLMENGAVAGPVCAVPSPTPGKISDGKEHLVYVHWDSTGHWLTLSLDTGSSVAFNDDLVNNVFGGISQVRWGWTGGTGGNGSIQSFSILNSSGCATSTPTPSLSPTPIPSPPVTPTPTASWTSSVTPSPTATGTATPTPVPGGHAFVYPNPVHGQTAFLAYQLDTPGTVRARIYNTAYDLAGRYEENNGPGNHVMRLDLVSTAPGVYFVLVEYETSLGRRKLSPIKFYIAGRP